MGRLFAATILITTVMALVNCGGGGGGGGNDTSPTVTVSGNIVKGYIYDSTITFYALNNDGSRGATLGSGVSDSDGNFSVSLSPIPSSPFLAESSGGSYVDEVSGATVDLTSDDHLCAVLPANTTQFSVSSLTQMACERAIISAGNGVDLDDAVNSANASIANQFNLTSIVSVLAVDASNSTDVNTAALNTRLYGIVLAGIAQQADSLGVDAFDLSLALSEDASDGILDGMNGSNSITIPGSVITLSSTAGLSDLQSAIDTFVASINNKTNITTAEVSTVAVNIGINTAGSIYSTTSALPAWTYGESGSAQITVSGGTSPYTCAVTSGSVPTGLSLASDCTLSGTIADPGGSPMTIFTPFTVTVTDSAVSPATVDVQVSVTVVAAGPTLTPVTSNTCTAELNCNVQVATVSGGSSPYYFVSDTFANGAPPMGLTIGTDGYLTGVTPESAGTNSFGICVVDSVGAQDCDITSINIDVPGIEKWDGIYIGSYTGSATGTQQGDFDINGTTSVTVSSGSISGTSSDGDLSGTINLNGSVSMGVVGVVSCPAQFTGSVTLSPDNSRSGSGSWSCSVTGGGSASGTWSIANAP